MTVPALTTADIATFAYYRQTSCTYVQLADVLSIMHSYRQLGEYVDGTIKIFDTGSESASPNNYVLVNVRIRADGWIMAWFPRTLMTGTADSGSGVTVTDTGMEMQRNGETSAGSVAANELAGYIFKPTSGSLSGNEYTIKSNTATTITLHGKYGDDVSTNVGALTGDTYNILQSRGNLVWWGHTSSAVGDPTAQTTRLGRALYQMWEDLKGNQQGGSGAALVYSDVGYWDYEYTSAAYLYIFGYSKYAARGETGRCGFQQIDDKYYYCTIPAGVTTYSAALNHGARVEELNCGDYARLYIGATLKYNYTGDNITYGFLNSDQTAVFASGYGIQKTIRSCSMTDRLGYYYNNNAIILLTSG